MKTLSRAGRRVHKRKKRDLVACMDNTADIDTQLANKKLMQDILGFTGDDVSKLFDQAMGFLSQHRYDEAISAFRLLTRINPFISDFWLGWGYALQSQGAYQEALSQYLVAETMDPERIDTYEYAIELCLEMHDFLQAKAVLAEGYAYVTRHHGKSGARQLRLGLNLLKAKISEAM